MAIDLVLAVVRWMLPALLLASASPQVLAQQRDQGAAKVTAQASLPAAKANNLRRLAAGTVFRDCADCPEMVVIPRGRVKVAASENGGGNGAAAPQRVLTLPGAIGMGKYEVTRAQYARFVEEAGYATKGSCFVWSGLRYEHDVSKSWREPGFAQTDEDPVVCVNWNDARAYTRWLSAKSGQAYRLPTEAEWEYAARAGSTALRPWGDDARETCRYANVADLSTMRGVPGTTSWLFHDCDDKHAYTAPVGSYQANAYGLYDMLGNAWEWTEDCQDDANAGAQSDDPQCPKGACCRRVLRGGAWVDSPTFVRYDFRFFIGSADRDFYAGFRVVRSK